MSMNKLPRLTPINLNKVDKKKILLLSDDLRIPSGVGTMSKALVFGSVDKYDFAQIGGAVKHPEEGKVFDISQDMQKQTGVQDAYCRIYPVSGYGNEEILRQVIEIEKPDAIMHFTDPRFWGWLYAMEHELRQNMPLLYLNIWDDLPYPHWNENAYESCDLLMAISKQTYNINKNVCVRKPRVEGKDLTYVQHGIDETIFKPIDEQDKAFNEFKSKLFQGKDIKFTVMFNSRNIHRKRPSDLLLGFKKFCNKLTPEQASECLLLFHTDPVDANGTDLPACVSALAPECQVAFSGQKLPPDQLNYIYNIADVVACPSSAEGFGLSHMEGIMSGTPTLATVLGGLQDQMGFKVDGEELSVKHFTAEIPSNSTGEISKDHGVWTYPLWPQMNLQGSPATPYIYDSRPSVDQIAEGIAYWYNMTAEERKAKGLAGRNWAIENGFTQKGMCDAFKESVEIAFNNFTPRARYTITDTSEEPLKRNKGILI